MILLAIVFLFVLKTKGTKKPVINTANDTQNISNLQNEFVSALLNVQNITLDTGFLSSPVFKSLVASGANVNLNPPKGRADPFSKTGNESQILVEEIVDQTPIRTLDFGIKTPPANDNLLSPVKINISKITSSTASIAITGIPKDTIITIQLDSGNNKPIDLDVFTYKLFNQEYSVIATNLTPKTKYIVTITNPGIFKNIQAEFTTK